jgi:hypothetical protein
MPPTLPSAVVGPLTLDLTGPARTVADIGSNGESITVADPAESPVAPKATINSATADFLAWSAKRRPWQ